MSVTLYFARHERIESEEWEEAPKTYHRRARFGGREVLRKTADGAPDFLPWGTTPEKAASALIQYHQDKVEVAELRLTSADAALQKAITKMAMALQDWATPADKGEA